MGLARRLLCLDWDKRSLRILVTRAVRGGVRIEDAHLHRLPPGVDADEPEAMGPLIAQTLARHRIRLKRAVVNVPRERAVINRLTLPPTPLHELPSAVRFQALKELPFPLEDACIDFVVLSREGGAATEVLLAAVRRETLERLRATCSAAGLELARVGLRPCANLVSVQHLPGMAERRVMFVDVGPSTSEIDVFRGGLLAFSRAANVSVPFPAGEPTGEDGRVSAKAELSEASLSEEFESAAVHELLVEISRTLQAYRATEAGAPVDQFVVAGCTGLEPALAQALAQRFNLPAVLFDPSGVLGVPPAEAVKLRSFSSVLGLAQGLSESGQLEIDFLNPKKPVPRGEPLRRRLRLGGLAAVLVLAALGTWALHEFMQLNAAIARLDEAVNGAGESFRNRVREMVKIELKTAEVAHWEQEMAQTVWLDQLLWLTRSAVEPGRQIVVSQVEFDGEAAKVSLRLAAANMEAVNTFLRQINQVQHEGRPLFRAALDRWDEVKDAGARLRFTTMLTIRLVELERLREAARKREAENKRLLDV